jgi:hypothetical protein
MRKPSGLKAFIDTPPWEWPSDASQTFLEALSDRHATESERMLATQLAGDFTVINEALVNGLLSLLGDRTESEQLRARAAISLGPVLEYADTADFDDLDDLKITEETFHKIQISLEKLFNLQDDSKLVRRRILEASVRAPVDWHTGAISKAYASGDSDWMLTAVFAMQYVKGFEKQILESMKSSDLKIQNEAIQAAGNWELDAAWSFIVSLIKKAGTPKNLLCSAIEAVGSIRPNEAREVLGALARSRDPEIADIAQDTIMMAEGFSGDDDFDEEDDKDANDAKGWIN